MESYIICRGKRIEIEALEICSQEDNFYIQAELSDVANALPTDIGNVFTSIFSLYVNNPDNIQRNIKYAEELDAFDENFNGESDLRISDWRKENIVTIPNLSNDLADQIYKLTFYFKKNGKNGFSLSFDVFASRKHRETENGSHFDSFNLNRSVAFTDDYKIIFQL